MHGQIYHFFEYVAALPGNLNRQKVIVHQQVVEQTSSKYQSQQRSGWVGQEEDRVYGHEKVVPEERVVAAGLVQVQSHRY